MPENSWLFLGLMHFKLDKNYIERYRYRYRYIDIYAVGINIIIYSDNLAKVLSLKFSWLVPSPSYQNDLPTKFL